MCFGLDIVKFLINFVEKHLELFLSENNEDLNLDEIKSKVSEKYSVLVTTISLLEFAEISDERVKKVLVDLK